MPKRKGGFVPSPDEIRKIEGNPFLTDAQAMEHHIDGTVTVADVEHKREKDKLLQENAALQNERNRLYEVKNYHHTPLNIYSVDPYPALSRYYEKKDIERAVLEELERKKRAKSQERVRRQPSKPRKTKSKKPKPRAKSKSRSKTKSKK